MCVFTRCLSMNNSIHIALRSTGIRAVEKLNIAPFVNEEGSNLSPVAMAFLVQSPKMNYTATAK